MVGFSIWLGRFLANGALSAVVAAAVKLFYGHRRFGVENFERLRCELRDDHQLRAIKDKLPGDSSADLLSEAELRVYLEFFEVVGAYWKRRLIDRRLLNEILADYNSTCTSIRGQRLSSLLNGTNGKMTANYENFNLVAKWCVRTENREKFWTRIKRRARRK